jgi:hypothetical protein
VLVDEILSKLSSFVSSKDSRLACAAAVILSELAPRNQGVVRELVTGLDYADPVRRPFIIEALGRIGTPDAAAALVPLIKAGGANSEHALRAIAHTASAALKPLLQLLGAVPPALLERVAECVARTGETAAFAGLLAHLAAAEVDICEAVRNGVRVALTSLDAKSRENLRKQLEKCFQDSKYAKHPPALAILLKLAGDLGDAALMRQLAEHTGVSHPVHVRRTALLSLAALQLTPEQRAKLAPKLLPLMLESDIGNMAEPALEALRQARLGSEHQGQLSKLLSSPSSRIREFAMQVLAAEGSARTFNELMACLDNPDRSLRQDALSALSRSPSAAAALAERLLKLEGGEQAQETAHALVPQAAHIPHRLLATLAAKYVDLTGDNGKRPLDARLKADEKRKAIASVFRAANAPELVAAVSAQALKLRKRGAIEQSYELLRGVSGLAGWNDELRIEMALAGLSFGPKDLARIARSSDSNLQILQEILFSGRMGAKELAKRVLKDPLLNRKVVYYLGFHFLERTNAEREFGRLLLEDLAESRTEEGRQAKEKLIIEGLLTMKTGKAGILEERAKVLLAASDMVAADRAREEKKAHKHKAKPKAKAKKDNHHKKH